MSAPLIKGSCPGALHPMMSGDGLVVRVRPFGGVLGVDQAAGLATLADTCGNGLIDLSARANVQLRGVTPDSHPTLLDGLRDLALIDQDARREGRRNIVVTPFWHPGDVTQDITTALTKALGVQNAPDLPVKFGFAVDTGGAPVLQTTSADIRFEHGPQGELLLVADGCDRGKMITAHSSIVEGLALAAWFAQHRGTHKRMAALLQTGIPLPSGFDTPRQTQTWRPAPGRAPGGVLLGLAFGQMTARTLQALAGTGPLRMTPWRMILANHVPDDSEGLILDPADPLLRITACTGAPRCAQGVAPTRPLAKRLARALKPDQTLHISGCAKGCAHPGPAPLTLTATADGFDLIRNGRASDMPGVTALSPDDILKAI